MDAGYTTGNIFTAAGLERGRKSRPAATSSAGPQLRQPTTEFAGDKSRSSAAAATALPYHPGRTRRHQRRRSAADRRYRPGLFATTANVQRCPALDNRTPAVSPHNTPSRQSQQRPARVFDAAAVVTSAADRPDAPAIRKFSTDDFVSMICFRRGRRVHNRQHLHGCRPRARLQVQTRGNQLRRPTAQAADNRIRRR